MEKVAVVFWSGTGNTETMANFVAKGARDNGGNVDIFSACEFDKSMIENYDGIAFGCPSMGSEVLEETEFQPMWDDVKDNLVEKKIVLFGSYGWGDGEWMRNWEDECSPIKSYICNDSPNTDDETACEALGKLIC